MSGRLTQLDISSDDILWGVNSARQIYIRNGNGWTQVGGSLKHVSVGKAGVWGVNSHRDIYYREGVTLSNPKGFLWKHIPGKEELTIFIYSTLYKNKLVVSDAFLVDQYFIDQNNKKFAWLLQPSFLLF